MPEGAETAVDSWTTLRTDLGKYRLACDSPSYTDIEKISAYCPGATRALPHATAHGMVTPSERSIREWPRVEQFLRTCHRYKQLTADQRLDSAARRSRDWADPDDISLEDWRKRWGALTDGKPMLVAVTPNVPAPAVPGIRPAHALPRKIRLFTILTAVVLVTGGVWALALDHTSSNGTKKEGNSPTALASGRVILAVPTTPLSGNLHQALPCPADRLCIFPGTNGVGTPGIFHDGADAFRGNLTSLFDHAYSVWNRSNKTTWCLFTDTNIDIPPADWRGTAYKIPPGEPVDIVPSVAVTLESAEPCERLG